MTKQKTKKHSVDALAALLLFGIFAVCILGVVLTGAKTYRGLTTRDQEAYASRTAVQYLATRVRQAPTTDAIDVTDFGGSDCLELTEWYGPFAYTTRIYCYDGWLRELFCEADSDFEPDAGEKVLPAQDLSLALQSGLLTMDLTDSYGTQSRLCMALPGDGEVQP